MSNTEQPQMAQYNWRTGGAVSHTKKEKNMTKTKQEVKQWLKKTGGCDNLNHFWFHICPACKKEVE